MAHSLSILFVHIVYHVNMASVGIREDDENDLYAYIGSIIKSNNSIPIIINGVDDHIHILCILSKNMALAKLIEEIKKNSSRWIKELDPYYKSFSWQRGYGGFSVSYSLQDRVKKYIENQKAHHKKINFQEEYLRILKEYAIEFKEQYSLTNASQ